MAGDPERDVLIIGAGAAGGAMAWSLARRGVDVVCLRMRSLDGVGVDWPIDYEDLAPFYAVNETEVGVAGLAGDPWSPPRPPLPLPPAPLGRPGRLLVDGYERLGWDWWPTEQALVTRPYDGRPACDHRSFCPFGCPERSLSTTDVTYWRKALATSRGVDLRTGARVQEITLRPDGRAGGALYYDAAGRAQEVRARVVVLAAGGIGTPRLLLLTASSRHPRGLANGSGMVGRNLMVHVQSFVVGRFDEPVDGWRGTWGGNVSTRQFYETDPARNYLRGFIMSGCPGWSPLNLALQIATHPSRCSSWATTCGETKLNGRRGARASSTTTCTPTGSPTPPRVMGSSARIPRAASRPTSSAMTRSFPSRASEGTRAVIRTWLPWGWSRKGCQSRSTGCSSIRAGRSSGISP